MLFKEEKDSESCFYHLVKLCISKPLLNETLDDNENAILSQWVGTIVVHGAYIPTGKIIRSIYRINNMNSTQLDRIPTAAFQKLVNVHTNDKALNASIQDSFIPLFINTLSMDVVLKKEENKIEDSEKGMRHKFDDVGIHINKSFRRVKTEFVTILGIFSAIVFAMFGGIGLFGSVFDKTNYLNSNSVGNAIFIGAIYLFGIYLVLLLLLLGLFKIVKPSKIKICDLLNHLNSINLYLIYCFVAIGTVGLLYSHMSWIVVILLIVLLPGAIHLIKNKL